MTYPLQAHRDVDAAALANLDAWIPKLQLYRCEHRAGVYRAVASWRPSATGKPEKDRERSVIISPYGIHDESEGKGYTPIELVMAACGADSNTAAWWLRDKIAPAPPIVLRAKRTVPQAPSPSPEIDERSSDAILRDALVYVQRLLRSGRTSQADAELGRTIVALAK